MSLDLLFQFSLPYRLYVNKRKGGIAWFDFGGEESMPPRPHHETATDIKPTVRGMTS